MVKKSLAAATVVVVVTIGTVVIGAVRLPAAAATQPARSGAAASDCVTPAMMRQAARARQDRVVCISQQPPPGAPKARTRPGPRGIPAKQKPARGTTAVSCPEGVWGMGRHEVCVVLPGFINIWQIFCSTVGCVPVLVGWMEISTTLRSKTWPHQGS